MSFPKAKLQRFNDIQDPTPSPADYNISTKKDVNGAIISKSERFTEFRRSASSDSFFASNGPTPTFKMPNPPRKPKGGSASVNRKTELDVTEASLLERLKSVENENSQLRTTVDKQNSLICLLRDNRVKAHERTCSLLMKTEQKIRHLREEIQKLKLEVASQD